MEKPVKEFIYRLLPPFLQKTALTVAALLRDPKYTWLYSRRFCNLSTEEIRHIIEHQYVESFGCRPDLDTPKTLNEKINWLKLYYRDKIITDCSDKVLFRKYIAETIGSRYLVPAIGVYNNPDEINIDELPNKFVAKVNWGSGQNIICADKRHLDWPAACRQLREWLKPKNNHYYDFLEWCYKDIEPKILVEQYLEDANGLPDYKVFCYNGEPQNMFIAKDRSKGPEMLSFTFFDMNFKRLDVAQHYRTFPGEIQKPECWDEMIRIARILSKPFPFVRVDFYEVNGELKVGELTFYHFGGFVPFEPPEWDLRFGELLTLPSAKPT